MSSWQQRFDPGAVKKAARSAVATLCVGIWLVGCDPFGKNIYIVNNSDRPIYVELTNSGPPGPSPVVPAHSEKLVFTSCSGSGDATLSYFDAKTHEKLDSRHLTADDIRRARREDELRFAYPPKSP